MQTEHRYKIFLKTPESLSAFPPTQTGWPNAAPQIGMFLYQPLLEMPLHVALLMFKNFLCWFGVCTFFEVGYMFIFQVHCLMLVVL